MPTPTRISLALALCFCSLGNAAADSRSPITAVTLYPGSATVERTAQVTPGMTRLEISGLPANFDLQTLRAQADDGIQIGQIMTRDIGRTESVGTREAELEAKIQALQDKLATLDVDARSAALVQKFLENLNGADAAASGRQMPYIDAKSMATLLDTIRRGGSDAFERIQKAEVQKREVSKQIAALQRDLAKVTSGARDSRSITVSLAARQTGTLKLSYQVNGAGWKPGYRALLDSDASTVALERLASVSHKTGEDWSNVKLTLSTGQPRLSPQAPEPRPWLLSYRNPAQAQIPRPTPLAAAAPKMATDARTLARADVADDYQPPVLETQGTFATEFTVPARVSLPADGREISVTLATLNIPVRQRVRVAPRVDKSAVVTAEAARPAGVWLPGTIQLFRDGSYVGASYWNTQASDKFVFSFGRDDLIRVAIDRAGDQSGSTGFLAPQNERKIADVYTVTSFHKIPVDLLLLESSPVSTSDEVKVQAAYNPQPTTMAWEQRRGVVGWETVIDPNQALKFSLDYTIAYPKEGRVTGLP